MMFRRPRLYHACGALLHGSAVFLALAAASGHLAGIVHHVRRYRRL
jgi:hypothetical protein